MHFISVFAFSDSFLLFGFLQAIRSTKCSICLSCSGFVFDALSFFWSNVEGLSNPQLIYPAPCPAYPLPGICGQSHLNCSLTTNISLALFFNIISKWGSVKWCKLQAKSKFSIFQNLWIKFREAASSATAQTKTPGVQTSGSKGPELADCGKTSPVSTMQKTGLTIHYSFLVLSG